MQTLHVQIVMSSHVNGANRLFGGRLMEWLDVVSAVEARRHAGSDVTLAAVDAIEFIASARVNDVVVLIAETTWTGRTSIEVRAEAYVERMNGDRELINRAYLVFVAIEEDGQPRPVPAYVPETEEQQAEWLQAVQRRELRLARRRARTDARPAPAAPAGHPDRQSHRR